MEFAYDPEKSETNARKHGIDFETAQELWQDNGLLVLPSRFADETRYMSETNEENLEERFEGGASVLDYFDTDVVLTIDRLAQLAPILNLSAVARQAGINVQTLQAKIRRRTLLTGDETRRIVGVLKRHHLKTVS